MSGDLIDTTEMYLRTVLDLEEEGITPMRARIVERLHHSGPTVSQTVSRMERDGLVTRQGRQDDRRVVIAEITPAGSCPIVWGSSENSAIHPGSSRPRRPSGRRPRPWRRRRPPRGPSAARGHR